MASLTLGTVFKFDDRDGVELILGADGAPKEGSVNFKKLVRSIAPVASAASTEGCSLLRGRLTIEYASVLQAASRFLYILDMYHIQRSHHIGRLRLPSLCEMAEAFDKLACHVVAGFTGTTCVSATNAPLARARSGPLHDRAHQGTELDRVQRLWRGQRVRSWIAALTSATIAVQRVHRGVVARKLAAARRAARARREARAIYHYHATLAQRTFRGFYSRRYRHDFRARRRYVEAVVATGEALRERLDQRRAARELDDQAADDARRAGALAAAARHLHHLVSTASAPGVYAAPVFDPRSAPTARGATMETHLRAGVRGALALSRRRYAEPPPSSAASLRAAAPFDAPRDAERLAARVARAGFVGACVEINQCVGCTRILH